MADELKLGDRVRIKNDYPDYKSMRGFEGKIIWVGKADGRPFYQVETDTPSSRTGRNFCFSWAEHLEILREVSHE